MKLIVGLGNPGEKYKNNRHNVGFMLLDFIVEQVQSEKFKVKNYSGKFEVDKHLEAKIAEIEINDAKIILAKPQTFMNDSGRSVKKIISNFKFPFGHAQGEQISNLIVVHDDLDIRFGEFKIQKGKGPKLHNGIESIENHLRTNDFWRVRIGVDNRDGENRTPGEAYVLQNFGKEEEKILLTVFDKVVKDPNLFS